MTGYPFLDADDIGDGLREMKCWHCLREWTAMCHASSEQLECPQCHNMVRVKPAAPETLEAQHTAAIAYLNRLMAIRCDHTTTKAETENRTFRLCDTIEWWLKRNGLARWGRQHGHVAGAPPHTENGTST